ncbi:MAG: asparagine synthase (glutamine-hydrolyzing) [Bryobacteraceae bacterium]
MCGIAGFTHLDGCPDAAIIRRAAESIRHRGPDQQGVFESSVVSLAAVRLKILDLATGDQPITREGTTIVFNGEIYNFRDLRHELESQGHRFQTQCDTEVVLQAWLAWGKRAFEKLRGMFALAIWSEADRTLTLARDRLGIKPLYIARRGPDLHFGSELKALLTHPDLERRLNHRALPLYLSLNYLPQPFTLIDGIEKLAPGTWLQWRKGETTTETYWAPSFARVDSRISFDDAKQQLDTLLDRSVQEHLLSDVPLGVWLSGGLDSSTITHYATRHFPGKLKTFSVSFRGRGFDESRYFQQVAAAFDTDHHELDLSPDEDIPAAIESIAHFSDEPSADAGALPVFFLARMTRQHVTVALSGEGADELFGGYQTYLADRYARWLRPFPKPVLQALRGIAELLPASDDKIGFDYKAKRFLDGAMLPPALAHVFWNGAAPLDGFARELETAFAPLPREAGYLNQFLYLDQRLYLPDDILNKSDRMSMAHSLEVRPPFLDHRIVEFAATLPEEFKIRGSKLKFILRELMRDKLPAAVIHRPKEGFDIPAHHWFRTSLRTFLRDTITERAVRDSGLFEWSAMKRLMDDHDRRRINAGYRLWGLLILFLWMEQWGVDTRR